MDKFEKEILFDDDTPVARDERLDEAVKSILSYRHGRKFFYELIGVCHFGRSSFCGEATNTSQALAGKQQVGEWAMDLLNRVHPEAYALMIKEARENTQYDDRKQQSSNGSDSTREFATADSSGEQPK